MREPIRRGVAMGIVMVMGVLVPAWARGESASHAIPAGDTLATLVGRWSSSVGGNDRWTHLAGVHLRGRGVVGGVPAIMESWIAREGLRTSIVEGSDHSEWVCRGAQAWWHDWNGKTRALAGRDLADAVTDAFVRALVFGGPSSAALARVRARDLGEDSTHTVRRIRLEPAGGVPCELFLDARSGRPARAVRWPYDDPVTLAFEDWRSVGGVTVPFTVLEIDREGNADSTLIREVSLLGARDLPGFARPADSPPDVSLSHAEGALAIPFDFGNDHLMVQCRVNDGKPLWFLIDTGANYNVINRPRLAELGLTSFGGSTTSGGGGSTGLEFTHVDRLAIGDATLLHQREGVLDLSGLERLYGMPMGGLLGMDFLDRFVVEVDYDRRVLNLYPADRDPSLAKGTSVPFVLEEGHPHVRGSIVVDDGPPIATDFIIDSGAAESANLTSPFVREHRLLERARRTPPPAPTITPGTEKQFFTQTTVRGRLRAIRIGDVEVRDIPVNLQQGTTGAYASPSFSGTIGERILSHFNTTYDYARATISMAPNGSTAKPFPPRTTFGVSLVADGDDYTRFTVAGVRKDSPADSIGFRKGDVISALDGRAASGWRLAEIRAALADPGRRHSARIQRSGQPDTSFDFIVRTVSIEDR